MYQPISSVARERNIFNTDEAAQPAISLRVSRCKGYVALARCVSPSTQLKVALSSPFKTVVRNTGKRAERVPLSKPFKIPFFDGAYLSIIFPVLFYASFPRYGFPRPANAIFRITPLLFAPGSINTRPFGALFFIPLFISFTFYSFNLFMFNFYGNDIAHAYCAFLN